jgi:hypothetical protein
MSRFASITVLAAFLNGARANFADDTESALLILNDLPKILASPFCASFVGRSETTTTWTETGSPMTITTTLAPTQCSETTGYVSTPWETSVCRFSKPFDNLLNLYRLRTPLVMDTRQQMRRDIIRTRRHLRPLTQENPHTHLSTKDTLPTRLRTQPIRTQQPLPHHTPRQILPATQSTLAPMSPSTKDTLPTHPSTPRTLKRPLHTLCTPRSQRPVIIHTPRYLRLPPQKNPHTHLSTKDTLQTRLRIQPIRTQQPLLHHTSRQRLPAIQFTLVPMRLSIKDTLPTRLRTQPIRTQQPLPHHTPRPTRPATRQTPSQMSQVMRFTRQSLQPHQPTHPMRLSINLTRRRPRHRLLMRRMSRAIQIWQRFTRLPTPTTLAQMRPALRLT